MEKKSVKVYVTRDKSNPKEVILWSDNTAIFMSKEVFTLDSKKAQLKNEGILKISDYLFRCIFKFYPRVGYTYKLNIGVDRVSGIRINEYEENEEE